MLPLQKCAKPKQSSFLEGFAPALTLGEVTFTSIEFQLLQFTPLWVFLLVAEADGMLCDRKLDVLTHKILNPVNFKSCLAKVLIQSLSLDADQRIYRQFTADDREKLGGLQEAAALLRQKLSARELQDFKAEMLKVGHFTANAAKPWFHIFVNPQAKQALAQIAEVFGA
jgi:hypothetical protein